MQLEISVSLDQNRPIFCRQARKRQHVAGQVYGKRRSTDRIIRGSELEVRRIGAGGWIVRIGLKVDPARLPRQTWIVMGSERQTGVARCTPNRIEHGLAHEIR